MKNMLAEKPQPVITETELLGIRTKSNLGLARRVETGLAFDSMELLSKKTGLPLEQIRTAVRITPRTMARRRNENRLSPAESDRLVSISRLLALAIGLFGGRTSNAIRWFTSPIRALGMRSPIEVASTEVGSREVEDLIGRLEHGVFS